MIKTSRFIRLGAMTLLSSGIVAGIAAGTAGAQELASQAVAPWMTEKPAAPPMGAEWDMPTPYSAEDDLAIKRISLADLQNLTTPDEVLSPLEDSYYGRVIDDLRQFGYDIFKDANLIKQEMTSVPAGVVQDNYVLSVGDKIDFLLRGQENSRKTYEVDPQGLLVIDNFSPITAIGQTLGAVRQTLEKEAALMHNTEVFVSLSGMRQINVLVVGHVPHPGRQMMTAFHTVLDALSAAGGIQKTGSLRKIKLVRGGKSTFVDLYSVLMDNSANAEMSLQEGDRIIVPPVGQSVAVSGNVKRPAIYEVRPNQKLSLAEMLGLAGGVMTPGNNRYMKLSVTPQGREAVSDVQDDKARLFGDGSVLVVAQGETKRAQDVTLSGHTREPGTHDLMRARSLAELISNEGVLGDDIYPLIGIIERRDTNQLTKNLIEFSPRQVIRKDFDRQLEEGDVVHLFSMNQIRALESIPEGNEETPLLHEASYQLQKPARDETRIRDPLIASFLRERSAFVRGAVRQAGAYPVADGATLDSVLAIAGGTTLEANVSKIEVTSRLQGEDHQEHGRSGTRRINVNLRSDNPQDILIGPGDTVRVNQKFNRIEDQSVTLLGEVVHPGRYDLMPGDTVLSLIERAGGLTEQGYPDGAIFSRAAERKREASRYKAQAQDLEMKLAASLQQTEDDKKPDMAQIQAVQTLVAQLNDAEPVGRITVEVDPESLKADPEQDMLLEAGDKIYIPKRPLNVRVAGEVLSPAALQFRKGKDADDYIDEAGGTTYYADADRTFIILPDGSARPMSISAWNHESSMIPPGSTIIVPRDPKPYNFLEGAERISQILANLAISGLYVDAISDDN
jgi:polysaccharide export outer membrane protein